MDAYKMTASEVAATFGVDTEVGLSAYEVANSAKKYGQNKLTKAKSKSIFARIFDGLTEPMMIILLVALTITIAVNMIKSARGEAFDFVECVGIVCAIALSVGITLVMEGRSAKAFEAVGRISKNLSVKVRRDGKIIQILQEDLVVGDIILFDAGDKIPVDCRLIKSDSLRVDESPLTGESVPVKKDSGAVLTAKKVPLAERKNMLYGGCFITMGRAEAVVVGVGDYTEIGGIARALSGVEGDLTPLQRKLDKLGKTIAAFGGIAAGAVFIIQLIVLFVNNIVSFDSVQEIFITSIVLIVASVPEGLPTIVAVSLALNVIKMAKQNALVKKMVACETVGSISIICSDKTGTLTENKMTVTELQTQKTLLKPNQITDQFLLKNMAINSGANISAASDGSYNFIGSATECALLAAFAQSSKTPYQRVRSLAKIKHIYPFSSETKRMGTIVSEGGKNILYLKGAPEVVLNMCELNSVSKNEILAKIAFHQANAKRVIALAHRTVADLDFEAERKKVESELIFDGFAVISDPIRSEVYAAMSSCRRAGVAVKMLTGDNIITARAIAFELGIATSDDEIFHADTIEAMSDAELIKSLPQIKVVARSTPQTKLKVVKALKNAGEVVAVTGDGINDAPAIKHADIGIAMGIAGTEVSKEASDIVLLDDSFSTIVKSVQWGRGIYENFQRFILFQLTVNLSAVLVTVLCSMLGMGAPFNALELLWINLIMDGPPALTLGLEPIKEGLMKRKPIGRDASIVTKRMMLRITANAMFISAIMMSQAYFNFLGVWVEKERTAMFALFVIFQLFNAFNSRELGSESIFSSPFKNKLMLIVMVITFSLQIIITQNGNTFINTVPLNLIDWLKITALALSIIVFNEIFKVVFNAFAPENRLRTRVLKSAKIS